MCPGSIYAKASKDATQGATYQITSTAHQGGSHRHGVLHLPGEGLVPQPADKKRHGERIVACAACIREPTQVELSSIPSRLQAEYGIGETQAVMFVPGSDIVGQGKDAIELADGARIDLVDLADAGITLRLIPVSAALPVGTQAIQPAEHELEDA